MANPDELVDIVDENDQVLYQTTKGKAHIEGLLHRCVIGLVINSNGEHVLVKQTPDRQDAGQYVSPVGGHVQAGENTDDALKRETEEEIGLKDISFKCIGKKIFSREVIGRKENHFFIVYEIYSDEEYTLGPEAESYKAFSPEELRHLLKTSPQLFGNSYLFQLKMFYPEIL